MEKIIIIVIAEKIVENHMIDGVISYYNLSIWKQTFGLTKVYSNHLHSLRVIFAKFKF